MTDDDATWQVPPPSRSHSPVLNQLHPPNHPGHGGTVGIRPYYPWPDTLTVQPHPMVGRGSSLGFRLPSGGGCDRIEEAHPACGYSALTVAVSLHRAWPTRLISVQTLTFSGQLGAPRHGTALDTTSSHNAAPLTRT